MAVWNDVLKETTSDPIVNTDFPNRIRLIRTILIDTCNNTFDIRLYDVYSKHCQRTTPLVRLALTALAEVVLEGVLYTGLTSLTVEVLAVAASVMDNFTMIRIGITTILMNVVSLISKYFLIH